MGIIISEEAKELITNMANSKNEVEIYQTFNIPVFNILWRIVGGKRYEVRIDLNTLYGNC